MSRKVLTTLGALLAGSASLLAEPTQFWASWTVDDWANDKFSTQTNVENRHGDGFDLIYFRATQKFYYDLNDTWTLGAHPVIETARSGDDWSETYRLDLEVNPTFKLSDRLSLKVRNRYEVRRKEDHGDANYDRYRLRTILSYKANWLPGMTAISVGNEVYYDFSAERINADRIYPLQLSFKPSDHFKTTVYYLYETKRQGLSEDWEGKHVIGLSSGFQF